MKRSAPLRRTALKPKRATPRRRKAPRWDSGEWGDADLILSARAGYACEKCGKECGPLERHHRMRRRDGGESYPQILMLGRECHAETHAHPATSRKFGWIVSAYVADASTIPVLWRSKEWMFLTADGGMVPAFDVEAPTRNEAAPIRRQLGAAAGVLAGTTIEPTQPRNIRVN